MTLIRPRPHSVNRGHVVSFELMKARWRHVVSSPVLVFQHFVIRGGGAEIFQRIGGHSFCEVTVTLSFDLQLKDHAHVDWTCGGRGVKLCVRADRHTAVRRWMNNKRY